VAYWDGCCIYEPNDMPPEPCCYAIVVEGEIVYIGKSNNLRRRITSGHAIRYTHVGLEAPKISAISTPWGIFRATGTLLRFRRTPIEELSHVEMKLIKKLRPRFNKAGLV